MGEKTGRIKKGIGGSRRRNGSRGNLAPVKEGKIL